MKSSRGWLISIIGIFVLVIALSALSSLAQIRLPVGVPVLPHVPDLLKVAHSACPECFTYVCPECYVVFEEVPGTGIILTREIPNPAPLEPDATRLEFDLETGLPIWYIGRQPYVGPTDEEPFSAEFPVPKIVLKRIQARHRAELASIPGVHAFGIGAKGFLVFLDPKHPENEALIPKTIEKVPVEVQMGGPFETLSHGSLRYRPVPTGVTVGAFRPEGGNAGTTGPYIVLNSPTRIWTLTAGHIVKRPSESPSVVQNREVFQPAPTFPAPIFWGVVAHSFQQSPCAHPPTCTGDPANFSSVAPDVAVIAHISISHNEAPSGHTSPTNSAEPIRKMYKGTTDHVNGPSGIVQMVRQGKTIRWWGAFSTPHRIQGQVTATNVETAVTDGLSGQTFKYSALDFVRLENAAAGGDSGGLVAGEGIG
ncbi:MAG: hypothetical protein ACRERD_08220, partial [Candidatus Binatia bacterium]